MNNALVRRSIAACAVALLAAGCGGGGSGDGAERTSDEPAQADAGAATTAVDDTEADDADADAAELLEGETVVEDAFDDGDGNGWIYESPLPGRSVEVALEDDALFFEGGIEGQSNRWPHALDDDAQDFTDQRVSATLAVTEGGTIGVICRMTPEGALPEQYTFNVSSAGTYDITKFDADEIDPITLATDPPQLKEQLDEGVEPGDIDIEPAFAFDQDDQHEVVGQCVDGDEGVDLTMWVDGEVVLTATDVDDPIDAGLAGITVDASLIATGGEFEAYDAMADDFEMVVAGGSGAPSSDGPDDEPTGQDASIVVGDEIATATLEAQAIGFPAEGAGETWYYNPDGLLLGLDEPGFTAPVAGEVEVPADGIAVAVDVRGASILTSADDYWGVSCNVSAADGSFYAFVGSGADAPGEYEVLIIKYRDGGFEILAEDTVATSTNELRLGGGCVTGADGTMRLEMSVGDERVLEHVDGDPLPAGAAGLYFESSEGGSSGEFRNFLVTEAALG